MRCYAPAEEFMRRLSLIVPIAAALLSAGCEDDNGAPTINAIDAQRALVGSELTLTLSASDPDGDALSFSFSSDLESISNRASLSPSADGSSASFHFTPLVGDVGDHGFDFVVSDGEATAGVHMNIEIGASGEGSAPSFVQPLGTGITLDVLQSTCLEVPVLVQDPDTPGVTLGQEEPLIAGAELQQASELTGTWSFCPSPDQIEADDRYQLTLSADDFDNPKTLKPYLIVLRTPNKPDCPGDAPVVTHTPENVSSVNDLTIVAEVSDDQGIKYEPLLYYSATPPGDPPDVTQMTQLTMLLLDGDMRSGSWGADVPNPVANQSPGSTAQLYYVIVAQDNDDADGNCDHLTQTPVSGAYNITVDNPGGSGGLGLCDDCTADAQCGVAGDLCVFLGGDHHCFTACVDSNQCPSGYYCSFSELSSIDNALGRQCIPNDYMCDGGGGGCVDDGFEENDTRTVASGNATLMPGTHPGLKSCPDGNGDDEDYYRLDVSSDAIVALSISGGSTTDLDLALYDSTGTLVDKSDSLSSNESLSQCLTPGIYYARVYGWGSAENSYTLTYGQTPSNCGFSNCSDDGNEDDDNAQLARLVDLNNGVYQSTTNAICGWDDDWFEVQMFNGETLYSTLTFQQNNNAEDLDIYVYRNGTNLTGCDEQTPQNCDPNNGQSVSSDESLQWPISQSDTYYVVVHGWNGAENLYDICIGLGPNDCP
jgi:hypothetical protein